MKKKTQQQEPQRNTATGEQVAIYDKIEPQLKGLCNEVRELSRKKPNDLLNKFKLKIINEKVGTANSLLIGEFTPFENFEVFDEDNLPSNSDVVFILSQYVKSLEVWRAAHIHKDALGYKSYWNTADGTSMEA